ncbi:hypothetical protein D027_0526A, partial [Vibrio parahaemolyticus 861]
MVPIRPLNTAF